MSLYILTTTHAARICSIFQTYRRREVLTFAHHAGRRYTE